MTATDNLFAIPAGAAGEETVATLLEQPGFTLERIVSRGAASPEGFWYDQELGEWVVLLQGEAELRYESGEVVTLRAGDPLLIPAHCRHRVERTSPDAVWLALFYQGTASHQSASAAQPPFGAQAR